MRNESSSGQDALEKLAKFRLARDVCAEHFDLTVNSLLRGTRRICTGAKIHLIYLLRTELEMTEEEAAAAVKLLQPTINRHVRKHKELMQHDVRYADEYELFLTKYRIRLSEGLDVHSV